MADAMSPSIAPEPGDTGGFNLKTWATKHWWILALVGAVVVFLLYSFRKTSSAATPTANTTSDGSTGVSATQPDQSNVIDMLSSQFQELMTQLQNGATAKPPTTNPGVIGDPHGPANFTPWPNGRRGGIVQSAPVGTRVVASKTKRAGVGGARLAHGGVPPVGAAVPFGTFVHTHDPLISSGMMYTNDRAV